MNRIIPIVIFVLIHVCSMTSAETVKEGDIRVLEGKIVRIIQVIGGKEGTKIVKVVEIRDKIKKAIKRLKFKHPGRASLERSDVGWQVEVGKDFNMSMLIEGIGVKDDRYVVSLHHWFSWHQYEYRMANGRWTTKFIPKTVIRRIPNSRRHVMYVATLKTANLIVRKLSIGDRVDVSGIIEQVEARGWSSNSKKVRVEVNFTLRDGDIVKPMQFIKSGKGSRLYHKMKCRQLKRAKKRQILSKEEIKKQKLIPCTVCRPM